MKKTIYLSFILLICNFYTVTSQVWEPFYIDKTFLYVEESSGGVKVIRMDSSEIGNNETLYYTFPAIYAAPDECVGSPYWLNNPCVVKSSGELVYLNNTGDTMTINLQAMPGDSVYMGTTSWNNAEILLWTEVDSIREELVLGIPDSVKYFSIKGQGLTSSGNFINDNVFHFKFSKSFGFVSLINFYSFPWGFIPVFNLAGMSEPEIGLQYPASIRSYIEMNIGDEFHFYREDQNWFHDIYNEKNLYLVLNKTWAVDSNSVTYDYLKLRLITSSPPFQYEVQYDTLTLVQDFTSTDHQWILSLPDSMIAVPPDEYVFTTFSNNHIPDKSSKMIVSCYWEGYWGYRVIEGCGFPSITTIGGGNPGYSVETIKYYRKGNYSWGTPYDWEYFLSLSTQDESASASLLLFPNPTTDYLNIKYAGSNTDKIEIWDVASRKLFETAMNVEEIKVDVSFLPPGIYFLSLKNKAGQVVLRTKLIIGH